MSLGVELLGGELLLQVSWSSSVCWIPSEAWAALLGFKYGGMSPTPPTSDWLIYI